MKKLEKLTLLPLDETTLSKINGGKLPPAGTNPNPFNTAGATQFSGVTTYPNGSQTDEFDDDKSDYEYDFA